MLGLKLTPFSSQSEKKLFLLNCVCACILFKCVLSLNDCVVKNLVVKCCYFPLVNFFNVEHHCP